MKKIVNGVSIDLTQEEIDAIAIERAAARKEQVKEQVKEIRRNKEREEFRFKNVDIKITEDEYVEMLQIALTLRMTDRPSRPDTVVLRINKRLVEVPVSDFFDVCVEIARKKRLNLVAEKTVREGLEDGTYSTREEALAAYEAIINPD